METPTDCLVLMIQEIEKKDLLIDNTLFILYDTQIGKYVIRGKRNDTNKLHFVPYSFTCKNKKDVFDFIYFSICYDNNISVDLYNYDNLPYDSNDITFDFLYNNVDRDYEIFAYDDIRLKRKNMLQMLKMLKKVSNEY